MRRVGAVLTVVAITAAGIASAAVFERYLSEDRPEDRAIMAYMALDAHGSATSVDLAEMGVLLLNKGFPKDAERYLERALDLDKNNVEARYRLGLVLQRQGEYRKAIRQFRKVAKQRPGHAYSRFMLALAEERAGNRDDAVYDYAKAYKHAPELADPAKNPLVLDSRLQVEAQLLRYRREVESDTIEVTAIDPEAVRQMMAVRPSEPQTGTAGRAEGDAQPTPAEPTQAQVPTPAAQVPPPAAVPVGTTPGPAFGGRPQPQPDQRTVPHIPRTTPTPTPTPDPQAS